MSRTSLLLASLTFSICALAQNTVGLISIAPEKMLAGYYLLYPHNQSNVFLLDQCVFFDFGCWRHVHHHFECRRINRRPVVPDVRARRLFKWFWEYVCMDECHAVH